MNLVERRTRTPLKRARTFTILMALFSDFLLQTWSFSSLYASTQSSVLSASRLNWKSWDRHIGLLCIVSKKYIATFFVCWKKKKDESQPRMETRHYTSCTVNAVHLLKILIWGAIIIADLARREMPALFHYFSQHQRIAGQQRPLVCAGGTRDRETASATPSSSTALMMKPHRRRGAGLAATKSSCELSCAAQRMLQTPFGRWKRSRLCADPIVRSIPVCISSTLSQAHTNCASHFLLFSFRSFASGIGLSHL